MKNIHLFIFIFLIPFTVTAQSQSIDPLKNVLKTAPQDTFRVNVLNNISTAFIQTGHFDSANRYIKPSVDLVEKLHYQTGAVIAFHNLAAYNFHIKEYKTGKYFLLKSLNAALLTNDKKNIAVDYKELADLYELQSNFKQARESKKKFNLYNDSLAKEESAKHAAETNAVPTINIEEEADKNTNKLKGLVDNNKQNQSILYITISTLLLLFIVWFVISRVKNKAKRNVSVKEKNVEPWQNKTIEKPTQLKETKIEKIAFLQKITEVEAKATSNNIENKQSPIEALMPIIEADKKESANELNDIKTDIAENLVSDKNEKASQQPAIESANIDVETTTNVTETEPTEKEELIEQDKFVVGEDENKDSSAAKNTSVKINKQYSNLILLNQLPLFTAKFLDDKIKLMWKTNNENNIIQFEIQKSADGVQFVSIESVAAQGFANNNYEIFDFKPLPGKNYYRLEIIDTEGNFNYGSTVQVDVLPVSTLTLICYPTQVKDVIMVTAAGGKLPVLVNIFNKAGKKEFTIETPPTTTPIYLNNLAVGTYTLQMQCQGKTILQQLIKVA